MHKCPVKFLIRLLAKLIPTVLTKANGGWGRGVSESCATCLEGFQGPDKLPLLLPQGEYQGDVGGAVAIAGSLLGGDVRVAVLAYLGLLAGWGVHVSTS